ncbi:MAG TPA: hypothetical protein VJH67_01240 [Candidatus Paceibacterota bacterium]
MIGTCTCGATDVELNEDGLCAACVAKAAAADVEEDAGDEAAE